MKIRIITDYSRINRTHLLSKHPWKNARKRVVVWRDTKLIPFPANIYLFKVNTKETPEKGVKYFQS